MEPLAGIRKIVKKGTEQPEAVRFHVPGADRTWDQVTWREMLARSREIALAPMPRLAPMSRALDGDGHFRIRSPDP